MAETLADTDKDRIRTELRYIAEYLAAQKELGKKEPGVVDRVLAVVSNGFVLLIAGSIITSCLIPHFQRESARRTERATAIQDCLAQFLQYSLSRYEEMMTVDPLGGTSAIAEEEYGTYMKKLSEIRLRRYAAFGRLQAASLVFRDGSSSKDAQSDVENKLYDYAVRIQAYSNEIDSWVGSLYCATERCVGQNGAPLTPYKTYRDLLRRIHDLDPSELEISALIVRYRTQVQE